MKIHVLRLIVVPRVVDGFEAAWGRQMSKERRVSERNMKDRRGCNQRFVYFYVELCIF